MIFRHDETFQYNFADIQNVYIPLQIVTMQHATGTGTATRRHS